MQKVKKSLVDELLNLNRFLWKNFDSLQDEERNKTISKTSELERQLSQQSKNPFFFFDELAGIVARGKLSDECYYGMLRACGFEVVA